jgi:pyrroline-5-carboxylate reductase
MGIAILSGVVASLDTVSRLVDGFEQPKKWESHTPGTVTPVNVSDATVPTRFIACVSRNESARKLSATFGGLGALGSSIEVVPSQNLASVQQADVIILW